MMNKNTMYVHTHIYIYIQANALLWIQIPKFPEIEQFIRDSVRQLGGDVFPKLNWSSPRASLSHTLSLITRCLLVAMIHRMQHGSQRLNH